MGKPLCSAERLVLFSPPMQQSRLDKAKLIIGPSRGLQGLRSLRLHRVPDHCRVSQLQRLPFRLQYGVRRGTGRTACLPGTAFRHPGRPGKLRSPARRRFPPYSCFSVFLSRGFGHRSVFVRKTADAFPVEGVPISPHPSSSGCAPLLAQFCNAQDSGLNQVGRA